MSKHEDKMIEWYWKDKVKEGTMVKEFPVCSQTKEHGRRLMDAVIILGTDLRCAKAMEVDLKGKNVIVVQAKAKRLGMSLMGQAVFSIELLKKFAPASIQSVALCRKSDSILEPMLRRISNVTVVEVPDNIR